ncbi:MAG: hypothetical protein H0T79_06105 [Deltaproteobacteria bacterium]|nr:hypothetical protein [Deltaproteobacteria bacterium]
MTLRVNAFILLVGVAAACSAPTVREPAPVVAATPGGDAATPDRGPVLRPTVDAVVAALGQIALVHAELLKGKSPESLHLAVFMEGDKVSGDERPVLSGRFAIAAPGDRQLLLQTRFDADPKQVVLVTLRMKGAKDSARLVDPVTGKETRLEDQETVSLEVSRSAAAAPSHPDRLRAAQLWSLIGEHIAAPYQPARFEAAVIGTQLVKTSAYFWNPGKGSWVLLKTTTPDELYLAFDVETGIIEVFPKTPMQPTEAARALFKAL